jgi:hypothetical protein
MTRSHTLTPLRALIAVAPSGGTITFVRYDDFPKSLSVFRGVLTEVEDQQLHKAELCANKPGLENWNKARALLVAAGWRVRDE